MAVEHASNGVYWSIENLWCRGVSYQKSVAVNCLSIARSIRSVVWISVRGLSWVMLFQFAPCFGVKRSFETKIGYEHFLWHTFDKTGRIKWNSEMGLLLLGISWSLCTSASFHASGNVLVVKEVLMMDMIVGRIEGRQSWITRTIIFAYWPVCQWQCFLILILFWKLFLTQNLSVYSFGYDTALWPTTAFANASIRYYNKNYWGSEIN